MSKRIREGLRAPEHAPPPLPPKPAIERRKDDLNIDRLKPKQQSLRDIGLPEGAATLDSRPSSNWLQVGVGLLLTPPRRSAPASASHLWRGQGFATGRPSSPLQRTHSHVAFGGRGGGACVHVCVCGIRPGPKPDHRPSLRASTPFHRLAKAQACADIDHARAGSLCRSLKLRSLGLRRPACCRAGSPACQPTRWASPVAH